MTRVKYVKEVFVILALLTTAAFAQPAPSFSPPDRELWDAMSKAFDDLPMSMNVHQQIQAIMANVQREAQAREARAKAFQTPKEDK